MNQGDDKARECGMDEDNTHSPCSCGSPENDRVQAAYYSILVKHGNFVLTCDPMIRNEPRP